MTSIITHAAGAAADAPAKDRRWVALVFVSYTAFFFGALPALLWALGGSADAALGLAPVEAARWRGIGLASTILGVAWMLASMAALRFRGRGWPISHLPPRAMVGRGPYAWMRHPIYVGYSVAMSGAGLATGSVGRAVLAPAFLTVGWIIYALGFEEPRLVARFGAGYRDYAERTPLVPFPFRERLVTLARAVWLASRPSVERVANRVVLFRTGRALWVTYGALVAVGTMVAAFLNAALLGGAGLSPIAIASFQLGLAASMLLGGRAVWLAYEWRRVVRAPSVVVRRVGFVSFGGYLGLVAFSALFSWWRGIDALALLDRVVVPGLAISVFGRVGCLSYGCCYGRPCAHGVRWTHPSAKVNRELGLDDGPRPRVPTPLLSSAYAALACATGLASLVHGAAPGASASLALLVYATARFGVECWRDEPRFWRVGFTRGQILAGVIAVAAIATLLLGPVGVEHARWDAAATLRALPASCAAAVLVFVVCGLHRREVGAW